MTDRGLQAQRTSLAWTRTSFAVLANGALLMVRDIRHHSTGWGLASAALAVVIAAVTFLLGVQRQRTLAKEPLPQSITPGGEVYLLTGLVLALIAISVLSLLL